MLSNKLKLVTLCAFCYGAASSVMAQGTPVNTIVHSGTVVRCESFVAQNQKKTVHDPHVAAYNATPGYVVTSYTPRVMNDLGYTTWSLSYVQAGSSVISSSQLATAYSYAHSLVASLNIPTVIKASFDGSLSGSYSYDSSTLVQLQSSHAGLILNTDAWGAGLLTWKGRNWIAVEVWDVTEMQIPACFSSELAMKQQLKKKVDEAYAKWNRIHRWHDWIIAESAVRFANVSTGLKHSIAPSTIAAMKSLVLSPAGEGLGAIPTIQPGLRAAIPAVAGRIIQSGVSGDVSVQVRTDAEYRAELKMMMEAKPEKD